MDAGGITVGVRPMVPSAGHVLAYPLQDLLVAVAADLAAAAGRMQQGPLPQQIRDLTGAHPVSIRGHGQRFPTMRCRPPNELATESRNLLLLRFRFTPSTFLPQSRCGRQDVTRRQHPDVLFDGDLIDGHTSQPGPHHPGPALTPRELRLLHRTPVCIPSGFTTHQTHTTPVTSWHVVAILTREHCPGPASLPLGVLRVGFTPPRWLGSSGLRR